MVLIVLPCGLPTVDFSIRTKLRQAKRRIFRQAPERSVSFAPMTEVMPYDILKPPASCHCAETPLPCSNDKPLPVSTRLTIKESGTVRGYYEYAPGRRPLIKMKRGFTVPMDFDNRSHPRPPTPRWLES